MGRAQRYIERRKYRRKNLYCLIKYKPAKNSALSIRAFTSIRNISGGGILFRSNEQLPVGTELDISVNLPHVDKIIDVSGKIVRLERIKGADCYLVGAEFTKITEEDRNVLIQLAEK